MSEQRQPLSDIHEARDVYQISVTFDEPEDLSVTLEMPRLPPLGTRLGIIFLGNLVTTMKYPPGLYEVVESASGVSPKERYSGTIALRRLSTDGPVPVVAGDWFAVSVL